MLTSKVAKRYAQGLLDFTQESGNTATVFAEMKDVVKIMKDSKELKNFFASPIIDAKKKIAVATEVFVNFSPVAQNLITLSSNKVEKVICKVLHKNYQQSRRFTRSTENYSYSGYRTF
jgi:F0F1-type ATP synthase delta subunit